ncbi:hypothetical protein ACE01N_07605 [Saccharicrinis sp. FJH2]|uniref:hypothetical protein n=1 Tax=Saccharicrinis sp. FJH65 TaxID=3344659 RepID=UPI0035F39CD3
MKKIIVSIVIVICSQFIKSQPFNVIFYSGYSTDGKHYADIPLEVELEYFPVDWFSVFAGYEKFNSSYDEFDNPMYAFYGIGFNSQFSYNLPKLGFNYYPLINGRSKVAIGTFVGRGKVSRNSTPFISYLDSRESEGSDKIYEIAIISGDYKKNLTGYGVHFRYTYEVLKDQLSLGVKIDYTGFKFMDTFKCYVPDVIGVKLSVGVLLNKPE